MLRAHKCLPYLNLNLRDFIHQNTTAGFDGYVSDPLGGQLCMSLEDYQTATKMVSGVFPMHFVLLDANFSYFSC